MADVLGVSSNWAGSCSSANRTTDAVVSSLLCEDRCTILGRVFCCGDNDMSSSSLNTTEVFLRLERGGVPRASLISLYLGFRSVFVFVGVCVVVADGGEGSQLIMCIIIDLGGLRERGVRRGIKVLI